MDPRTLRRRSPLAPLLAAQGARFTALADGAIAASISPSGETERARSLALADLTPLPRLGFKGRDTADWLAGHGIGVPALSNRAARLRDGELAVRLAPGEALLLAPLDGDSDMMHRLAAAPPDPAALCFPVPRRDSHCWLLVTGHDAPAMFAKLCGVDLRPAHFANHQVAQTSLARMNAILIRDDRGRVPAFHVLADWAAAEYLWGALLDAMAEFDGRAVGWEAVRGL